MAKKVVESDKTLVAIVGIRSSQQELPRVPTTFLCDLLLGGQFPKKSDLWWIANLMHMNSIFRDHLG